MVNDSGRMPLVAGALCAMTLASLAGSASAAEFVVDRGDDVSAGDGMTTLREAVALASQSEGADTIRFHESLQGTAITLDRTGDDTFGPTALRLDGALTIDGGEGVTLQRDVLDGAFRLLYVPAGANVTLRKLILTGGLAAGGNGANAGQRGSGGGGAAGLGGAILNEGTLRLERCELIGNGAAGGHGGSPDEAGGQPIAGGGGGGGLANSGTQGVLRDGGKGGGALGGTGGQSSATPLAGQPGGFGSGGGGGAAGIIAVFPNAPGGDGGFGGGGGGGAAFDWTGLSGGAGANAGHGGFGGGGGGAGAGTPEGVLGNGGYGGGNGGTGNLTGNFGAPGGGGAAFGGALCNLDGALELVGCYFEANVCTGGLPGSGTSAFLAAEPGVARGGAVFLRNGSTDVLNTLFRTNTATGGADVLQLADGGASSLVLVNTTFDPDAVQPWLPASINAGGFFASNRTTGDGSLYLDAARFNVNWAQHGKGKSKDSLTLAGSLNLDGVAATFPGGFLTVTVGGETVVDSVPFDARGRAFTAPGAIRPVRTRLHPTRGRFNMSIKGLDLRTAVGVVNETGTGPLDVPIKLTLAIGAIRVPTWSGTFRFRQTTRRTARSKGVFAFRKDATTSSAFRVLKASVKPKGDGHVLSLKAVFAGLDGVSIALDERDGPELELDLGPTAHAELDQEGLDLFFDVEGGPLTRVVDPGNNAPEIDWLILDTRKGMLSLKSKPIDLGLPGEESTELEAKLRVRLVVHSTQGPFPFETTITVRRKATKSGRWKH